MKKKFFITLIACFIGAGSFVHYSLESGHTWDFSLEDIATMAQADREQNPPGTYTCYTTWKGTWIGGWHIVDCFTCTQKRVSEFRDQSQCTVS